jgi:TRAP transporter 4TM/12TM fusion protein
MATEAALPSAHTPIIQKILTGLAVLLSLFVAYTTVYGPYRTTIVFLVIFLGASFTLYFLKDEGIVPIPWPKRIVNYLCVVGTLGAVVHIMADLDRILASWGADYLTTGDMVFGIILVLVVLEAARRESFGFFVLSVIAILYILYGNVLPGLLGQPGMSIRNFVYLTSYTSEGIFGIGLEVTATYLFMFMLLSAAMEETKTGTFIIDLCNAYVGKSIGGALKSCVLASACMGTMIGSSIGNVVTTGTFTIPLMKRTGMPDYKAGAVETVASEGSQFLPPVMGAGAFIMAELTGIPYVDIAVAALIPALLYFLSLFAVVHVEARKLGLRPLHGDEIPNAKQVFRDFWHLLLAPLALFYLLMVKGYTPGYSGLVAVVIALIVAMLRKGTRFNTRQFVAVFANGARSSARIAALITAVGFIQQAIVTTGLGAHFTTLILTETGGTVIVTLIIAVIIATLLGMGMPTPIAYILLALFVAPAMEKVGIPVLATHLFLFYFAIKSGSTPPVAVVAVVAAGIAGANWWKTGIWAFLYSLPGFVVAFMFVYSPPLLMHGAWYDIAIAIVTAVIGVIGIAVALQGWWNHHLNLVERILIGAGSICLIDANLWVTLAGILLTVVGAGVIHMREQFIKDAGYRDIGAISMMKKAKGGL